MKNYINNKSWLVTAATITTLFASCTNDEIVTPTDESPTYSLTVNAIKGEKDGSTRALSLEGKTLNATWATGETVYVKRGSSSVGSLRPIANGISTTLKGELTGEFMVGQVLNLTFPRSTISYSGQIGTLNDIATKYDYATATATISDISDNKITADDGLGNAVEFTNQQAIVKFTLIDKADGSTRLNPTTLTIDYGTGSITLGIPSATYSTNGDGVIYVAIPGFTSQTVTLTATFNGSTYSFEKPTVTFANGNYYAISVQMTKTFDSLNTPLTFEAKTAGAVVTFTPPTNYISVSVEYSTDGTSWNTYTEPVTLANVGDKVSFRGNNLTYGGYFKGEYAYSNFACSANCFIYGNIMSLLSATGYSINKRLYDGKSYTFYKLFQNNDKIYSHPQKSLVLPATTLTSNCYREMFNGCSKLTYAPYLPATTLTEGCYRGMFSGCSNLLVAPELPATTPTQYCYCGMFSGCSSLTTAPELPATTVIEYCYASMFSGCTNLTKAPTVLPALSLREGCYQSMFNNCRSLTIAPDLPSSGVPSYSYNSMFSGCSNLNRVKCLATTITGKATTNNLSGWLYGVAAKGTFIKAAGMSNWPTGPNGIPEGWTVINE